MSRRIQNDFDEEINTEIDELTYRLRFRHPNSRKNNRIADNKPSHKKMRNRLKYDESEYDEH